MSKAEKDLDVQAEEQVEGSKEAVDPIMAAFEKMENGPSKEQIELWKNEHNGEVYISAFDEDEIYVWRPLYRLEYKNIIKMVKDPIMADEKMLEKCLLFPRVTPEFLSMTKAGTIETMAAQIREVSNFVNPETAIGLVRKL